MDVPAMFDDTPEEVVHGSAETCQKGRRVRAYRATTTQIVVHHLTAEFYPSVMFVGSGAPRGDVCWIKQPLEKVEVYHGISTRIYHKPKLLEYQLS